jgi:hypothetical protein
LATSNFRELENLVLTLEHGVSDGTLLDSEVKILTDNNTSKAVFWKGHSPNPFLNQLALGLWQLEMAGRTRIQMVHIPGTRMIAQGTDGLTRGDFTEGVMAGQSMLEHVPLHLTVLERQPTVLDWLMQWIYPMRARRTGLSGILPLRWLILPWKNCLNRVTNAPICLISSSFPAS